MKAGPVSRVNQKDHKSEKKVNQGKDPRIMAEVIVVSRFCFEPEKCCYSPLSLFCLAILDNPL